MFDSILGNAESSFEIYFTISGDKTEKTYNYGFCVDRHGVTEEWLNSKAKTARKFKSVFTVLLKKIHWTCQVFQRAVGRIFRWHWRSRF